MSVNESPLNVSLIIPAYNEERRIGKSLEQIFPFCNAQGYPYEVIVVDDGSTDETVALIRERFGDQPHLRILQQPVHRGKGAAVQQGMLQARGDYLIFSDADLSVPIEALPILLAELQNHCDCTIGSRRMAGSKIEVRQPRFRAIMGKSFRSCPTSSSALGTTTPLAVSKDSAAKQRGSYSRGSVCKTGVLIQRSFLSPVAKGFECRSSRSSGATMKPPKSACGKM